ncbi:glutathione S-transferase [Alsobacter sp. SYSU M60028]|uniref:Glutathione S-transferase n=1 Tax=Alsobacter ponti TaxID=2962936 RepID=A0ABT1L6L3_9HYPH|nr:glutathione S-transferase [Alsobacter ponti]MCP8937020.1 glutathione S-transferase [Alsobacter ponti]
MQLRYSPASPFARKVVIAAHLLGLKDRIAVTTTDTVNPDAAFLAENPLGKIPALVLDDGEVLFDSRVILDYLDQLSGGRLIAGGSARFADLRLEALADGVMDAALLQIYETRFRDEAGRSPAWVARQAAKVDRALAVLEAAPPSLDAITVGPIAVACALGYLDLRFGGAWRAGHPRLVAWLDAFAARVPAFEATRPA